MMFQIIAYQPLTREQKAPLLDILIAGNNILNDRYLAAAATVGKTARRDRYSRMKFRKELLAVIKTSPKQVKVRGVLVTKQDLKAILAVNAIEGKILAAHSNLIAKIARQWHRNNKEIPFEEFYNEGVTAMIKAIYGFRKSKIQFSTYAHRCINNRFIHFTNENHSLSRWNNNGSKLYSRYRKFVRSFNGPLTLDETVKHLKLTDDERISLEGMLRRVVKDSELHVQDSERSSDYTANGDTYTPPVLDVDQKDAIDRANLDDWEKAVLKAFQNAPTGSNGWKSEVARQNINPVTNTPYSRAAPAVAMQRIKSKILAAYKAA